MNETGRIHVLDQGTVDKIAAGEVVERPQSVIKELIENAIDAGADRITAEISDGGITKIRVTDNGRGISAEDIPLAFLRHATSKIETAGDLMSLRTLGFRGEALSSIAAVSRVEMITKRPEDLLAVRYLIEGGREKLCEEIGAPDGTTIIVRDLFYNTPARAKFLKTPLTEAAHVGDFVEQLLLANPGIAFTYIVNGRTTLATSGSGMLKDVIHHVYGREIAAHIVPVAFEEEGFSVAGFIGKPEISRGNRNFENYYINGRYVKSRIISRGIEDGYGTKLMQHQYPFTCLMITAESSSVDVNVHPTKMDVRFSDEKAVYEYVRRAVRDTLDGLEMVVESPSVGPSIKKEPASEAAPKTKPLQPFETKAAAAELPANKAVAEEQSVKEAGDPDMPKNSVSGAYEKADLPEAGGSRAAESRPAYAEHADSKGRFEQLSFTPKFLSEESKPMRRIVGQIFSTYWICEYGDKVYLFDQHAAHEKVLFEKFMRAYEDRKISSQSLMPPMVVTLDSREESVLLSYMEAFQALGFEIDHLGERDYAIRSVPYYLGTIDSGDLFRGLVDQLEINPRAGELRAYVHKVATEACKAAVKGGQRISQTEAERLLDDLMKCEDPYHCPHGRPTIISFTDKDIEKRFKRIV